MENKQTAVEWLVEEIEKHYIINNGSLNPTIVMELKRQAKQMEKEQIAKAWDGGDYAHFYSKETGKDFENGEEYYNETYESNT